MVKQSLRKCWGWTSHIGCEVHVVHEARRGCRGAEPVAFSAFVRLPTSCAQAACRSWPQRPGGVAGRGKSKLPPIPQPAEPRESGKAQERLEPPWWKPLAERVAPGLGRGSSKRTSPRPRSDARRSPRSPCRCWNAPCTCGRRAGESGPSPWRTGVVGGGWR